MGIKLYVSRIRFIFETILYRLGLGIGENLTILWSRYNIITLYHNNIGLILKKQRCMLFKSCNTTKIEKTGEKKDASGIVTYSVQQNPRLSRKETLN